MAICFQSNSCISFIIPVAILVSGGTGRKKVGYVRLFDNRGDEAPGDIYIYKEIMRIGLTSLQSDIKLT